MQLLNVESIHELTIAANLQSPWHVYFPLPLTSSRSNRKIEEALREADVSVIVKLQGR